MMQCLFEDLGDIVPDIKMTWDERKYNAKNATVSQGNHPSIKGRPQLILDTSLSIHIKRLLVNPNMLMKRMIGLIRGGRRGVGKATILTMTTKEARKEEEEENSNKGESA